jgi:hypothetical protein
MKPPLTCLNTIYSYKAVKTVVFTTKRRKNAKLLDCSQGWAGKFEKDGYSFMEDDEISTMGIIISGIATGDIFAESFACVKSGRFP